MLPLAVKNGRRIFGCEGEAANGANRVAIGIPCHWIIGKNGSMTGYGGSILRKAWLIAHEKREG